MEIVDSVMIRGQRSFEKYDQLNPIEIEIKHDRVINLLKKTKT